MEGSLATGCGFDRQVPLNDYLFRCEPGTLEKYPEWPTLYYHPERKLDLKGAELVYNDYGYIYDLYESTETGRIIIGK